VVLNLVEDFHNQARYSFQYKMMAGEMISGFEAEIMLITDLMIQGLLTKVSDIAPSFKERVNPRIGEGTD